MLHLPGSSSMVSQIPSSYSVVAIFFNKKRTLLTLNHRILIEPLLHSINY